MDTNSSKSSHSKMDRKAIEKNRRNQMKNLCSQLDSLVPHQASSSREPSTVPDQIGKATNYIQELQENVKNLKRIRESFDGDEESHCNTSNSRTGNSNPPVQIEVHGKGSFLEVIFVTGMECQYVFTEAIRILHEEHADVVNASYNVAENTVFHTIHAKIGEDGTNPEIARITERLKNIAL